MGAGVDPVILEALALDPAVTQIASHGGSIVTSTFKLTSRGGDGSDGKDDVKTFFVKTGTGEEARLMFEGEHLSLNVIHDAYFMATDFLELGSSASGGSGKSLAQKLGQLHTTPAPIPEGYDRPMYGFPVTTCCGSTPQDNSWKASWAEFYADNRLRGILKAGVKNNGADKEVSVAVEKTASTVVPRLLGDDHLKDVKPVIIHGDLWSGNHGRGRVAGRGGAEEVVFDASAVYGHSEYEIGDMKMFGGFGPSFWNEYLKIVPKSEPKEEWEDRVALYELYHHLNHWSMFGGGYRGGAMAIMKKLIAKYG
ncbi:phosphotransferase enzyme family protein [Apiospora hydei]|uniref:protein-ribulosamine 3-kinase n=1 Tax=Apiospora hydei TaxID=1337664 RepID=A0ABR1XCS6_9PEZI